MYRTDHHSFDLIESNESNVMTQPWESGIEELMVHYNSDDTGDDDTVIPQLDGKSDNVIGSIIYVICLKKGFFCMCSF